MLQYLRPFVFRILLRIALLTSLCLLGEAQLVEAPSRKVYPPNLYQPTLANFREAVFGGKPLQDCIIPSAYIVSILSSTPASVPKSSRMKLTLNSCRITGDLIKWELARVPFQVAISNSTVEPKLYLNSTELDGTVTFENVVFLQSVYFQGVIFRQRAVFTNVDFRGVSDFSGARFLSELSCEECSFAQLGQFSHVIVEPSGKLFFTARAIDSPMDFSGSKISGKVTFEGVTHTLQIRNKLYMNGINHGASLQGELELKNVEILGTLYLDQGNWARLDFAEMHLGSHRPIRFSSFADFRDTSFRKVDLEGAEFDGSADFSGATFLDSFNAERIKIRKPMRIQWKQIQDKTFHVDPLSGRKEPLSKDTYEELKRNFKTIEDLESENSCFYEMNQHYKRGPSWFFSWLMGHGVLWQNPFYFLLLSFLAFTFVNSLVLQRGHAFRHGVALTVEAAKGWKISLPNGFRFSPMGRFVFWTESLWMKFLEASLLIAVANTSPLLKDLIPFFGGK